MKGLTIIGIGILLFTSVAFAQVDSTNEFSIRIFGGEDIDPPTTPTLISVTPVASSQIDITWSVSTDDFALGGYVLYRDNAAFATTTLTTFSDTGLSPSTTYQYFVQAFDVAGNYSATSSTLATTTPDLPPPPATPAQATSSGNGGTAARVILDELVITGGFSTTSFAIKTARPARFEVRWGRTASYELGYTATDRFLSEYRTTLTDLEPGTVYEYEVIGYSPLGIPAILKRGQFKTLGTELRYAPQNVTRFTAVQSNSDVQLSWQLPVFDTFATVRIVRSHLGYPSHLQDGAVVYQGEATSFTDSNILDRYSPVYYTAFVIDTTGRVSSGAIAQVFAQGTESPGGISNPTGEVILPPVIEVTPEELLLPEFKMPQADEVFITQGSTADSFRPEVIRLRSEELFLVSIPQTAVAKNLKTIVATLTDPTDPSLNYSFLLRINNDFTAYEATVAPLLVNGQSLLTITIYDFEARKVGTRSQVLEFYTGKGAERLVFWPDAVVMFLPQILSVLFLCWLLLLMIVFYRRTKT